MKLPYTKGQPLSPRKQASRTEIKLLLGTHLYIEAEWERKQRNREYRVAARREKRNRKADEKKQRKLNATILRRMVSSIELQND